MSTKIIDFVFESSLEGKQAKTPKGWERVVKKLKKVKKVDNPWALVNFMKNKGDKPHKSK